jgi:hypothetical protein
MKNRIHRGYTICLTVKPGHGDSLRKLLDELNQQPSQMDFTKSRTTLFASGMVLPKTDYFGETLPETFVLATTCWGKIKDHIYDVIAAVKPALIDILNHTVEFGYHTLAKDDDLYYFLRYHSHHSTFNSSHNCITKQDISNEELLKNEIENYIDDGQQHNIFKGLTAGEIKKLIVRHINSRGSEFEWARESTRKTIGEYLKLKRFLLLLILGCAVLFATMTLTGITPPFINPGNKFNNWFLMNPKALNGLNTILFFLLVAISFFGVFFVYTAIKYRKRKRRYMAAERASDSRLRILASTQLNPVINEMTAAGPLKKGRFRRILYDFLLMLINEFVVGATIQTVRSARWFTTNQKRRLVFLSNFTNTTDFYIRDFLNGKTPVGINFMFNNGQGFPDSSFIFYKGIKKDPEGYIHAVHQGQQMTSFWYAHEKKLTVDIILKNREIRKGLFKKMNDANAQKWLRLF